MGNSQSLDKIQRVVKEGINIYKKVKKQQEQEQQQQQQQQQQQHQQYQQQSQYNNDNQHYGGGGGGGSGSHNYQASPDVDDDEEYSQLRAQAHDEAQKRNDCYARSQEAYKNGDGAEAKELSNQGHHHDNLMNQYNERAAEHIYSVKNRGRPLNEIDLHGLFVKEASAKVEEAIQRCQNNGSKDLVIIVGKGLHSPGQIAKLKPAIIELVKKYNVSCQPNIPNPGCLYVEFGKGTGDLSWLDRVTDKMANDQCIIM